jgi:CyaY protein
MTDSEYLTLAEQALGAIEEAIETSGVDIDAERSGNVLTLEFDDGGKIIVNLQAPMHEIWVAAKAGGFHFRYRDGAWMDTRSDSELFGALSMFASQQSGENVVLSPQ